jgi:parallel beta-helix repeat protein
VISRSRFLLFGIVTAILLIATINGAMAATDNGTYNETGNASETAGSAGTLAPLNSEFAEYQTKVSTSEISPDEYGLGYMPSPVNLSHIEKSSMLGSSTGGRGIYATSAETYPSYYDLRAPGKVTPVKSQGSAGSCWAFATYSSLESCLVPSGTYDFSENNMKNLLNNWYGSPYQERFDSWEGGDAWMSAAYLARWSGPINESDDPYSTTYGMSPAGLSEQKHVQEVVRLTDMNAIKEAVMHYGAVQTSFYWQSQYYNATDHSYYCPREGGNHAVAIVGWDDNFTSPEFPEKGAYIIKNSWGTDWGEEGYFYLSYHDANAGDEATVFIAEETDNYDNIYQYDPLGWASSFGYETTSAWGASVFTAENDEALEAVSFYTTSNDTQYEINIYLAPTPGSPVNSSGAVAAVSGTCPEAGYHTVPLDAAVLLDSGRDFSVVIRFTTPGYTYPLAIEKPISGYSSKATANAGESYVSADGSSWSDLTGLYDDSNVCIKAFTSLFISTVDASGGADYASIQAAVDNSTEGCTIFVYPGTYNENVDVDKQLNIIATGGATVTKITAVSSDDHVFNVTSDGVTISGFNISGATGPSKAGICLYDSGNTLLSSNLVSDNANGIYLHSSNNNTIYNNHFNNSVNTYFTGTSTGNAWNTSKGRGSNIAGGPYLGGNFWHNSEGTGFSQAGEDADGDGICDSPYSLLPDNIDYLPLVTPDSTYPVINSITLNNSTPIRGDPVLVSVNATDNLGVEVVTANGIPLEFQGDNIWNGTITAMKGTRSVNVTAMDATTNIAWDDSITYTATTIPITVNAGGGADYTTIQAAVNASIPGDIILVHPGTYYENVDIDKQLDIISTGGAAVTKIIATSPDDHIFKITTDGVTISGFNVSGATGNFKAGIYSTSGNSTLINNTASNNSYGMYLSSAGNSILVNNTVSNNDWNGVYLVSSGNSTLINNTVSGNNYGIYLVSSSNSILVNNTVSNNVLNGVYLSFFSNNNTVTKNTVSYNTAQGLRLSSSSNNMIYNNVFNNPVNTFIDGACNNNVWNTTKIVGQNVIGGPYLGGNCWANPDGSGFSQTHFDNDGDGICESIHSLNDDNVDYLPLVLSDWNPWNDPDSAGSPDGTYITHGEVIEAYNCYVNSAPAPKTGISVSLNLVIRLYNAYASGTSM